MHGVRPIVAGCERDGGWCSSPYKGAAPALHAVHTVPLLLWPSWRAGRELATVAAWLCKLRVLATRQRCIF
jgi:hypothetical protein